MEALTLGYQTPEVFVIILLLMINLLLVIMGIMMIIDGIVGARSITRMMDRERTHFDQHPRIRRFVPPEDEGSL